MNIRQNPEINHEISRLGQPNPEIPRLEKWAGIAFPTTHVCFGFLPRPIKMAGELFVW